jgi:hypothetical protein
MAVSDVLLPNREARPIREKGLRLSGPLINQNRQYAQVINDYKDSLRSEIMGFRFIYIGIRVKNMDESIRFYTEVLRMKIVEKREKTIPTRGEIVTLKSPNSSQLMELNFCEEESPFYTPLFE